MADNDPKVSWCSQCGMEHSGPHEQTYLDKVAASYAREAWPDEPQPAPRERLTAEQRELLENSVSDENYPQGSAMRWPHLYKTAIRAALAEIDRLAKLVNDQNGTLAAFADRAVKAEAERDALSKKLSAAEGRANFWETREDETSANLTRAVEQRDALRALVALNAEAFERMAANQTLSFSTRDVARIAAEKNRAALAKGEKA